MDARNARPCYTGCNSWCMKRTIFAPIWQLALISGVGRSVGQSGFGLIKGFPIQRPMRISLLRTGHRVQTRVAAAGNMDKDVGAGASCSSKPRRASRSRAATTPRATSWCRSATSTGLPTCCCQRPSAWCARTHCGFALDAKTQAQLSAGRFVHRTKTAFRVEKAQALIEAYRLGLGEYAEKAKFLSTRQATPEQTRAYINKVFKLHELSDGTADERQSARSTAPRS